MIRKDRRGLVVALCAALLVLACQGEGDAGAGQDEDAAGQEGGLPPGHPPVEPAPEVGGGFELPEVPAGAGTGASALAWTIPAGWVEEEPNTPMRRAQYRVPGPEGPAECVVFYFGPGQGGNARDNALRWVDQFTQPDGSSSRDVAVLGEREVESGTVVTVEVGGTYDGGMMAGGGTPQPGQMLLGAIVEGPDANWFFKLTGPAATVEANRTAFDGLVGSVRLGA